MGEFCDNPLGHKNSNAGMAYLPGTGPDGTACRSCGYISREKKCIKFGELTRVKQSKLPVINPDSYSCKYYMGVK
jgi:hypothetical protein